MINTSEQKQFLSENVQCDTTTWTPLVKCAVPSCKNVFTKYDSKSVIKYHNFPKNIELYRLWLEKCNLRYDFYVEDIPKICTDHFLPSDYETSTNSDNSQLQILKSNAVPTQLLVDAEVELQSLTDKNILLKQKQAKMMKEHEAHVNKLNNLEKQRLLKEKKLKLVKKRYQQFNECSNFKEEKNLLKQVFSSSQIHVLLKKKKVVWSNDDMAMAFTLRQMGNRDNYLYLKNYLNFPLPSLSSVQRWAASM